MIGSSTDPEWIATVHEAARDAALLGVALSEEDVTNLYAEYLRGRESSDA